MAKTIKEISQEYASGYMNLDRQQVAEQACEYGANAVLNEIISCWDWENKDNRLVVPAELVLHKIEDKIKELKGEL